MEPTSDIDTALSMFTERTGILVPSVRRPVFVSALQRAMLRRGVTEPDRLWNRIFSDDALVEEFIRELAVGETYFFRDPQHFEFVRNRVIPEVFARRGVNHVLRAWSAGCSTGEEPYSLAIVFQQERIAPRTKIIATDLSRRALEHAIRGEYRAWSMRIDAAHNAREFMREDNGTWSLEPRIKRCVEFRQLNLMVDVFPGGGDLDLIFCRNVLIYFDREAIARVAQKLVDALSEGGYLVMGPSDPSILNYVSLERFAAPEGIFFRRPPIVRVDVPAQLQSLTAQPPPKAQSTVEPSDVTRGSTQPVVSGVDDVQGALAKGNYARAAELSSGLESGVETSLLHVRALANVDAHAAEQSCADAISRFPLSSELRYQHASLLLESGRDVDAEQALRRALYLDRTLAVGHALLGIILARRGEVDGAIRSFRNAHRLCCALPPDQLMHLSNGEPAVVMASAMLRQIEGLRDRVEASS